jgi:hypothetical protein
MGQRSLPKGWKYEVITYPRSDMMNKVIVDFGLKRWVLLSGWCCGEEKERIDC